jgi:hypothetical protein
LHTRSEGEFEQFQVKAKGEYTQGKAFDLNPAQEVSRECPRSNHGPPERWDVIAYISLWLDWSDNAALVDPQNICLSGHGYEDRETEPRQFLTI